MSTGKFLISLPTKDVTSVVDGDKVISSEYPLLSSISDTSISPGLVAIAGNPTGIATADVTHNLGYNPWVIAWGFQSGGSSTQIPSNASLPFSSADFSFTYSFPTVNKVRFTVFQGQSGATFTAYFFILTTSQ